MFRRAYKILIAVFVCVGSQSYADIHSTRKVLSNCCSDNPCVLEKYDRVAKSWCEYEKEHQGKWDLERVLKAVEYAAKKHEGQVRKDAEKTPYIIHPIGVAELLWDVGEIRSSNVLCAALLHDTLEDTDATEQEISTLFGSRVLYAVKEVTGDPNLSSQEKKQQQIVHAPQMSLDGRLVKLADRLYNVRDLRNSPPSWSQEMVDRYYLWGEKLRDVLVGTNEALDEALAAEINSHHKCEANPSVNED